MIQGGLQGRQQGGLTRHGGGKRQLGGAQHPVAGHQIETGGCLDDRLADVLRRVLGARHQQVADRQPNRVDVEDAGRYGQAALGVQVDQQDSLAHLAQRRAQVEGAGGLANAALLIGYRDDRHSPCSFPTGVDERTRLVRGKGRPHGRPQDRRR